MTYSLIMDFVLVVLLVVTIGYAMALHRRLGRLRRDKDELEGLAATFGEATKRAADSVSELRRTSEDLQEQIAKAQSLRDDLAFLTERGGSAADRLEEAIRASRDQAPPKAKSAAGRKASSEKNDEEIVAKSDAERELLKALQSAR